MPVLEDDLSLQTNKATEIPNNYFDKQINKLIHAGKWNYCCHASEKGINKINYGRKKRKKKKQGYYKSKKLIIIVVRGGIDFNCINSSNEDRFWPWTVVSETMTLKNEVGKKRWSSRKSVRNL